MKKRRKDLLKKIAFSLAAVVFFFLAFEAALRFLNAAPEPPPPVSPITFQQVPEPALSVDETGRTVRLSVYADRREVIEAKRPKNGFRVYSLGGSATMGMGFPHNGSFSRWLERMLAEVYPARPMEVLNMGSVGYSSEQEKILAREILQKGDPDLLVIYSGHNEFLDLKAKAALARVRTGRAALTENRFAHSVATVRFVRALLPAHRKMLDDEARILTDYLTETPPPEDIRFGYERFEKNLTETVRAAKAKGTPVILVTSLSNPAYNILDQVLWGEAQAASADWRVVHQAKGWLRLGRWDKAKAALEPLASFGRSLELLRINEAGGVRGIDSLSRQTRLELAETARAVIPVMLQKKPREDFMLFPLALCYQLLDDREHLDEILKEVREAGKTEPNSKSVRIQRLLYSQFGDAETFHREFMDYWVADDSQIWATPRINDIVRAVAAREGVPLIDLEKELPDWMDPTPAHYLLDYCHFNIEGAFETARLIYEKAAAAKILPAGARPADFRERLLAPDLEWLRTRAYDFTERDKWMGLDFRVCFVYGQTIPNPANFGAWAEQDGRDFSDKSVVKAFRENREWYDK